MVDYHSLRHLDNLLMQVYQISSFPFAFCRGLAGTFGMQEKNYELSGKIAERLKKTLEQNPNRYVLTECAACKMQIEHLSEAKVLHPIKILAQCYGK